jgi:site-specific DNA-methyltransferase (adenine-specific)
MELKIEYVDINSIKPYKNNAKLHPQEQIEQIKKSIEQFGMDDPIGIWKDEIVEGHGRLIACKELGYTEVPIIRLDHLTDEERKAYTLAHNKLTMNSDFDIDILNDELMNSFDTIDMSDFGFDINLDIEEETEIIEDEVPEVPEEPKAKLGDIYQLGNHRLMCGDSTSEEDVAKLMNGVKADMVFTDPPYGVSASGGRSQTKDKLGMKAIVNDELRKDDLTAFLSNFIKVMKYKDGASIYICYPWATQKEFTEAILENNLKIKNCIIWDKKVFGLNGFKGYRPQYEMIYFCCKEDFEWYGDKAQSNIWQISREIKREEQGNHPTPKPIELIAKALNNSSKQEDVILDVFGGSGSTLIACEQLNRKCYMMELDPHYIDVIIQRWENFTGERAVKIN